jgi:rRNA maturation protein Nop10
MKNESEQERKSHTVVCPKCGRQTSFSFPGDAIDEEGEF